MVEIGVSLSPEWEKVTIHQIVEDMKCKVENECATPVWTLIFICFVHSDWERERERERERQFVSFAVGSPNVLFVVCLLFDDFVVIAELVDLFSSSSSWLLPLLMLTLHVHVHQMV